MLPASLKLNSALHITHLTLHRFICPWQKLSTTSFCLAKSSAARRAQEDEPIASCQPKAKPKCPWQESNLSSSLNARTPQRGSAPMASSMILRGLLPRKRGENFSPHPFWFDSFKVNRTSAPGRNRTCHTQFRKLLLYPYELQGQ